MKNRVLNKGILTILAGVVLIVLLVSTSTPLGPLNVVRNILRIPLAPVQKLTIAATEKVGGFFMDIASMKEAREENTIMKETIRILEQRNLEMTELKRQNEAFKKLLNFQEIYADYGFLGAVIIGKDPGNWFDVFTIDRGMKDSLRPGSGYPVIAADGLVGRISNVELLSSNVVSIIDMDSTVSVRVARTRDLLVVRGDILLKADGLCRVDYIQPNADIEPGDVLETSGLGKVYPKGIRVGTIDKIIRNEGQFDAYAIMKPAVDFKRLEEVEVLTRNEKSETEATAAGGM